MLEIAFNVALGLIGLIGGYWAGRTIERAAQERAAEHLRRVDPPRRTAGAPANMEAQPSDVNRPKWRSGTFKSGPPHE